MANVFEIIEVISVPGRTDVLAVLKLVSGDVYAFHPTLSSPQLVGRWRITSTLPSNTAMFDASRIAVGLEGPPGLMSGMILVEACSDPCQDKGPPI